LADTPGGRNFDLILIGDYEGRALRYVAKVRAGFTPMRAALFEQIEGLETKACPFKNLPEARRGQWGALLTQAILSIPWATGFSGMTPTTT
jgi:hypothetical protein